MHILEMYIIYIYFTYIIYSIHIYVYVQLIFHHIPKVRNKTSYETPSFHTSGTARNVPYTILIHSHMNNLEKSPANMATAPIISGWLFGNMETCLTLFSRGFSSELPVNFWLVVWNMNFLTFHMLGIVTPTDQLIFFRGVGQPPTRLSWS